MAHRSGTGSPGRRPALRGIINPRVHTYIVVVADVQPRKQRKINQMVPSSSRRLGVAPGRIRRWVRDGFPMDTSVNVTFDDVEAARWDRTHRWKPRRRHPRPRGPGGPGSPVMTHARRRRFYERRRLGLGRRRLNAYFRRDDTRTPSSSLLRVPMIGARTASTRESGRTGRAPGRHTWHARGATEAAACMSTSALDGVPAELRDGKPIPSRWARRFARHF